MALDRKLQRDMLELMSKHYPDMVGIFDSISSTPESVIANLSYLQEHGLCEANLLPNIGGGWSFGDQRITAAGLDFLADDGGLTAILNVTTIKLHADTVREMLIAKAGASALPVEEKNLLKRQLQSLPEAALKAATDRLLQVGLDQMPAAIDWLRTLVGL